MRISDWSSDVCSSDLKDGDTRWWLLLGWSRFSELELLPYAPPDSGLDRYESKRSAGVRAYLPSAHENSSCAHAAHFRPFTSGMSDALVCRKSHSRGPRLGVPVGISGQLSNPDDSCRVRLPKISPPTTQCCEIGRDHV